MLAGDFNTVFDRSLDRRGSESFDVFRESSCALNLLLNACSSIDIWIYLHPTSSSYTWTMSNGSLSSRLDFILVAHVRVSTGSLRCYYVCSCSLSSFSWSWSSVLNDLEYFSLISNFWSDWLLRSPVFPPWLSGGTRGKVSLRDSLLDIAVFVPLSGYNTVASCLGWQTT